MGRNMKAFTTSYGEEQPYSNLQNSTTRTFRTVNVAIYQLGDL